MRLIEGLQSGMVMQRSLQSNACHITVRIDAKNPQVSLGRLVHVEGQIYTLEGIPVGGPYSFTVNDGDEYIEFQNIWVGDVWLLGGQSNMEGVGARREQDIWYDENPVEAIRACYMDDCWSAARTPLHNLWKSKDEGLRRKFLSRGYDPATLTDDACGVGPGLFIAKYMYEHTGVPQGLIPCAFGGTTMADWSPDNHTETSQYYPLLRRFAVCGSNVRGMFWYQGESNTGWVSSAHLIEMMQEFVFSLRRDLRLPTMPFVQMQIAMCHAWDMTQADNVAAWHKARRIQAEMGEHIPYFATVSTANAYFEDLIHIDADSQEAVGREAAMQMCALLGEPELSVPVLKSVEIKTGHPKGYTDVVLTYDHVVGKLVSDGAPYGFSITLAEETPFAYPRKGLNHIRLEENRVHILSGYTPEQLEIGYVWYGAGPNIICTIRDEAGRWLLAMGPVPIVKK